MLTTFIEKKNAVQNNKVYGRSWYINAYELICQIEKGHYLASATI